MNARRTLFGLMTRGGFQNPWRMAGQGSTGNVIAALCSFFVPGLGQLAWSAVINRDLPVLVAVSLLMACAIGVAGMLSGQKQTLEAAA